MPRDTVDLAPVEVDEIAIVDHMIGLLTPPNRWVKHVLAGDGGYCIYGALNMADHGRANWERSPLLGDVVFETKAAENVHERMSRLALPLWDRLFLDRAVPYAAIAFNNNPRTTHADILKFLRKLRRSFL